MASPGCSACEKRTSTSSIARVPAASAVSGPDDAPEDAALMSAAVGKLAPACSGCVDEHGWSPYPPQLITIRSGLTVRETSRDVDYAEHTLPDRRALSLHARVAADGIADENESRWRRHTAPYSLHESEMTAASIPWMMNPNPSRTANLVRCRTSQALLRRRIADR